MTESAERFDILVAGAGPVGAAFAARMAGVAEARGLRICIVDRRTPGITPGGGRFDPRVVALTEASRLLLERCGIWNDAVAARACPYYHMEVRDSEGTGFIEFDCTDVHQPDLGHIVENSVILGAAHERLDALDNVTTIFQPIDHLYRNEDETLVLALGDGREVTAPLLVAADGNRSFIREHCHFRLRDWDYGHSAVVTTIRTERSHRQTAFQWFTARGPLAFLPLRAADGDAHYSSIVWSQDHPVVKELMALEDEGFIQRLTRASEARLGSVTAVEKRFAFPLRQCHAVDYVQPGVALVGDAAHSIHPLAGQGVNLGFADVSALAEEIVRGLKRGLAIGEASTLARYQRRRKPDNLAMMAAMEGFKRLFAQDQPLLRVLRNRGMSGLNALRPVKNRLVRRAMGF